MNQCDHNHNTQSEVRLLPYSDNGNMCVCFVHYLREMIYRIDRNKELCATCQYSLPEWDTLKVYKGNE